MDIKDLIIKHVKKHGAVRVADIVEKTGLSRAYVHRFFKELKQENKIVLVGRTNLARYVLAGRNASARKALSFRTTMANKNLEEDMVLAQIKRETSIFESLKNNVSEIVEYAFTEMLNNAIEHSRSKKIVVEMRKGDGVVLFKVIDFGVGVFEDIKRKFKRADIFEAIELLLKGKQTTAPKTHTGEGIFFTSKAADKLVLHGSAKRLIFDNRIDDIFVREAKKKNGTEVMFEIAADCKRKLPAIFKEYSNENFIFDKTRVTVKLFELKDTSYVSRSQARRLLFGLEKFQRIILDFKNVKAVGQGFADEVFRVWQRKYPNITIAYINCTDNVEFIIRRALSRSRHV